MKKNKNDIKRINECILSDRVAVGESYCEVLSEDLDKVLKDYFDFKDLPMVSIVKQNGIFNVNVSFSAYSVKPVGFLPK